jgi:hypothetical protein
MKTLIRKVLMKSLLIYRAKATARTKAPGAITPFLRPKSVPEYGL